MKLKERIKDGDRRRKRLLTFLLILICGITGYFFLIRLGFLMPLSEIPSVLCLNSCLAEATVHPVLPNATLLNDQKPLSELLRDKGEPQQISILIEKNKYRLTVFNHLQPVKSYPVVFGSNPVGDKRYEGDQKTPEGIYRIRDLYPHTAWSKFIWLDYPTPISWRKHFQSKFTSEINWFLPIGGEIGIHGVPQGQDRLIEERSNWTWGCISLKNEDVNEIYQVIHRGTLVEILP